MAVPCAVFGTMLLDAVLLDAARVGDTTVAQGAHPRRNASGVSLVVVTSLFEQ